MEKEFFQISADDMKNKILNPLMKEIGPYLLLLFYCVCLLAATEIILRLAFGHGKMDSIQRKPSMEIDQCPAYSSGEKLEEGRQKSERNQQQPPFRIFVFGESSVQGYPFNERSNIPKWMSAYLGDLYPEKNIQVMNCGLSGADSILWSHLYFDSFKRNPDLMVIYAGHNNFVEPTMSPKLPRLSPVQKWFANLYILRLYNAAKLKRRPQEPHPMETEFLIKKASKVFQSHLREMLNESRKNNIPVIISTISPNRSGWIPGLTDLNAFCRKYRKDEEYKSECQAKEYFEQGNYKQALEIFRKLKGLHGHEWPDAFMTYYEAACLEKTGRFPEALISYDNAIRHDFYRHRAPNEFNEAIKSLEHIYGNLAIADSAAVLTKNARNGITGNDLFVDHVHPNIKAQTIIAMTIVKTIAENKIIDGAPSWKRIKTDAEYKRIMGIPMNETDAMELSFCFRLFEQRKFSLSLECYNNLSPVRLRFTEEAPVPVLQLLLGKDDLARRSFASFVHSHAAKKYTDADIVKAQARLKKSIFDEDQFYGRDFPAELRALPAPDFKSYMEHNTGLKFR